MFRAIFSPIIRSTCLYLQYLVVFTQVAAGWCLGWVETEVSGLCYVYTSRQQLCWTLQDTVNTGNCSWWWAKTSPETCWVNLNNKLIYIVHLVGYFLNYITMHGLTNVMFSLSSYKLLVLAFSNNFSWFNSLNPELNPIWYLLALLAHHFLHVSRMRVKSLTLRLLMSYIYGAPILDVSRSHTTTQHSR